MSTPPRPNGQLKGPELYAPRRIRMRSARENGGSPPLAGGDEQSDERQYEHREDGSDPVEAAHATLGDVISAALEREETDRVRPRSYGERLPQAADLRSSQSEPVGRMPLSVGLPGRPSRAGQSGARRPRLDPQAVPEPMAMETKRIPLALRVTLVIGFAAIVAFGITMVSSPQRFYEWTNHSIEHVATTAPAVPEVAVKPQFPPKVVGRYKSASEDKPNRLVDSGTTQVERSPSIRPATNSSARVDTRHPNARALEALAPEEAAYLRKQAGDLLKVGDIAAARLALQRLAEAGNAGAALALGRTFDPRYLADHDVIGISGDEAHAQMWYRRAKQLRSTEANRIHDQTAPTNLGLHQ